jgi:hypothetical protein
VIRQPRDRYHVLLGSMLAAAGGVLWGMNFGSLYQPAVLGILPGI